MHSFDEFRLKVAERELWRRDALLPINRYVFDCIAYLIEHRDRAVGRDELVAAVWGRVDVSDGHLNQVIARGRRALGDDAQTQQAIRTVPGFGYRWVGAVETTIDNRDDVGDPDEACTATLIAASNDALHQDTQAKQAPSPQTTIRPHRSRRRWAYAALFTIASCTGIAVFLLRSHPAPRPAAGANGVDANAVVVLPVDVDAPAESGWIELGAMDLIAHRLRSAGLRVTPSETVVTALHGSESPITPSDYARVRNVLGGGLLVEGRVTHSSHGWTMELTAINASGTERRVQAERDDAIQAARAASDLLLIAYGREPPRDDGNEATDAVQERLQQAQAASLVNQFELARTLLKGIPDDARIAPDVRFRLAELDFRAGHLEQAAEALSALLADPQVHGEPQRRGRAMVLSGNLKFRRSAFTEAVKDFDTAVGDLNQVDAPLDLCDALTRRGLTRVVLHDYDGASSDYSRARLLAEQAGDRLRIAHVEAAFGLLQIERRRLDLALPYLDMAIDQYEALGVIERVVTLRHVLNDTYALLLRWPEVLVLSDRQWAARDRIGDPGFALVIANRRVRLLLALGRFAEAEDVMADARQRYAGLRPGSFRYFHDLHAELASHLDRPDEVIAAVDAALETWPRDPSYDRYAYLILLRQRALIATGQATSQHIESWLPSPESDGVSVVFLVARAEWAMYLGDDEAAQRDFERAMKAAEDIGTPALISLAAQSYTDWLLTKGQLEKAAELAGRVAIWASDDFDCALLRVKVFHALGSREIWSLALEQAQALAGERTVPDALLTPPAAG